MKHGQLANERLLTEAGPKGKTTSLANLFRDNGYNTAMLGKQHSNLEPLENLPNGTFMGKIYFKAGIFAGTAIQGTRKGLNKTGSQVLYLPMKNTIWG